MRLARTPYPISIYHMGYRKVRTEKRCIIKNKKMGRPTSNPRDMRLSLRIAKSEMEDIEYCMEKLSISKIDVVLKGISLLKKDIEKNNDHTHTKENKY